LSYRPSNPALGAKLPSTRREFSRARSPSTCRAKFELVIKDSQVLGFTVPLSMLAKADKLIKRVTSAYWHKADRRGCLLSGPLSGSEGMLFAFQEFFRL
jgi:hypothetical protein